MFEFFIGIQFKQKKHQSGSVYTEQATKRCGRIQLCQQKSRRYWQWLSLQDGYALSALRYSGYFSVF
jgi:hypothetical protein